MRLLTFAVVMLGITGALAAFRGFYWHADAARTPERAPRNDQAARAVVDPARPEGAAIDFLPAKAGDTRDGEKLYARLAADCAQHLYEKAKKQPDNVHLLRQAAAHYRACLAHEPTTDAGELFVEAKKNLEQIEKRIAHDGKQAAVKKTTAEPKVVRETLPPAVREDEPAPTPAPVPAPVTKPKDESIMVGPDGVIFRKVR